MDAQLKYAAEGSNGQQGDDKMVDVESQDENQFSFALLGSSCFGAV